MRVLFSEINHCSYESRKLNIKLKTPPFILYNYLESESRCMVVWFHGMLRAKCSCCMFGTKAPIKSRDAMWWTPLATPWVHYTFDLKFILVIFMPRNLSLMPLCGEDSPRVWLYNPTRDHDPQFKNWGLESMDDCCLTELKVNPKESWPWSTKAELGTYSLTNNTQAGKHIPWGYWSNSQVRISGDGSEVYIFHKTAGGGYCHQDWELLDTSSCSQLSRPSFRTHTVEQLAAAV